MLQFVCILVFSLLRNKGHHADILYNLNMESPA